METNQQGLTKEEKVMFSILGIILLVAIGVLIINSFGSKKELDNNETPMTETSGQKDNIIDESTNDTEEILIEEEFDTDDTTYYPIVNIPSSPGEVEEEDQSTPKPIPQPIILNWTFKNTMVTNAFSGDVITIEKNVLLTNGEEKEASIVIMKYEQDTWNSIDISSGYLTVTTGLYKYIYSYGSSTKELLLIVSNKLSLDTISILKLNETIDETSSITQEDYDKLNTLITNSLLEKVEDVNKLTITNYVDTNNYLPLVITTNEDMTNKVITTNTLGIYINEEQKDWHEELTPNSILIWLDLNTIDLTSEYITLQIDGVTYELQLSISINNEESDTNQGELEDDVVEEENGDTENTSPEEETEPSEELNQEIDNENSNEEENEEEDLDPIEPTDDEIVENSSTQITPSDTQETEIINIEPEQNDISNIPS